MKPSPSLVLLGAALLGACATSSVLPSNTYESRDGDGQQVTEEFRDAYLAEELVMESILTDRSSGTLEVQFNLCNASSSRLSIEWALLWLGAGGERLETPRHWTPLVLDGSGFQTIKRTSPTAAAAGFKLAVRGPSGVR